MHRLIVSCCLLLPAARAADSPPDRRAYSWANPTPDARLRELSPDRPHVTESPFTVDAGRAQIEMDFASHARDRSGGEKTRAWTVAPLNLRLGMRSDLEAGLFLAPWTRVVREAPGAPRAVDAGFGDIALRAKYNFWGVDGGPSALGLIGDVVLPTAARGLGNRFVEPRVFLPMNLTVGEGFEIGAMTGAEVREEEPGARRRLVAINSVTFVRQLAGRLDGFVELVSEAGAGPHVAHLNTGCMLTLGRHLQCDAGVRFGLSDAADDLEVFAGATRRF